MVGIQMESEESQMPMRITVCSMTIPRMAVMIGMPERMIWLRDRLISTRLALFATMLATCKH